jgi:Holliday junction resolvase
MSAMSRRKGASAERELSKLLADELGIEVTRNTDPMRVKGGDILTIPGYSLEVKRCETLRRPTWWAQAVRQADRVRLEPVVMYRQSRHEWRALVSSDGGYRDVSWVEAIDRMRDKLARLHGIYREAA